MFKVIFLHTFRFPISRLMLLFQFKNPRLSSKGYASITKIYKNLTEDNKKYICNSENTKKNSEKQKKITDVFFN